MEGHFSDSPTLIRASSTFRYPFCNLQCLTRFRDQQVLKSAAASYGKQPQLPVACLPPKELQHPRRVDAFQPFFSAHGCFYPGLTIGKISASPPANSPRKPPRFLPRTGSESRSGWCGRGRTQPGGSVSGGQ